MNFYYFILFKSLYRFLLLLGYSFHAFPYFSLHLFCLTSSSIIFFPLLSIPFLVSPFSFSLSLSFPGLSYLSISFFLTFLTFPASLAFLLSIPSFLSPFSLFLFHSSASSAFPTSFFPLSFYFFSLLPPQLTLPPLFFPFHSLSSILLPLGPLTPPYLLLPPLLPPFLNLLFHSSPSSSSLLSSLFILPLPFLLLASSVR